MSEAHSANKAVDSIQQHLTDYACALNYDALPAETIHAAKVLIIDTLGGLVDGFDYEPCRIARKLAASQPNAEGATVIGTRMKTTIDMAAFVNATTARFVEANDVYARYKPRSSHGHPSDVIMPVLAVAEHVQSSGRDFITSVVLAYEVYLRIQDAFHNDGFDTTIFGCAGTAIAAGWLLDLSPSQLSHCIAMAVVPNNILRQVRLSHISMWNAVAAGYIGRAGVFAAMMAEAGMDGPHLPFEGKAGWCDHIARERFSLEAMGGHGEPFLIMGARIKPRPVCAYAVPSVMAAEKVMPALRGTKDITQITAEVFKGAHRMAEAHHWHPESRETADHSIPFGVATALMEGTVTTHSFDEAHLGNQELRALMQKVEVVENETFTRAFEGQPQQYRARITVITGNGERFIGESGGDADDLAAPKSNAQVAEKFHSHTDNAFGAEQANVILERLWRLEDMENVAGIPLYFTLG